MIKPNDLIAGFQSSLKEKWGYIYGMTHKMWTQEDQDSYYKKYKDDPKRKNSALNGGKWVGHWVTDCSGLFTYWFEKLGGYMCHGSNTMYLKYCTSKGTMVNGKRTDGQALKPGTAVFCLRESDGVYSHVGLYIGNGEVIEAEGTNAGVIKSKVTNKKWENWGELKGVSYSDYESIKPPEQQTEPVNPSDQGTGESGWTPAQPQSNRPTLKRGSKGEWVTALQTKLLNLGYDLGTAGVDGDFGKATEKAVKAFQMASGLKDDGIVGKQTWSALDQQNEPITYTATITGLNAEQIASLQKEFPGKISVKEG